VKGIPLRRVTELAVTGLASAVLALTATACGSDSTTAGGSTSDKGVGMAYDVGGRGDHSFNDSAAKGFNAAKKAFKVDGKELTANDGETESDRETRLTSLAQAGYNPVIAVGYSYGESVTKVAKKFPKTTFGLVDSESTDRNVDNILFTEEQSSYLAGVAAALKTRTDKVGFIGGVNVPLIQKFQAGYEQGVKDTNPKVKVTSQYLYATDAKGYNDPASGKSKAQGMLSSGIDVIYTAAGASGAGSIEAVAGQKGAWAIGVDSDQYQYANLAKYRNSILTSALNNVNVGVYDLIASVVKDKKPLTGTHRYGLKDGGVGLASSGGFIDDIKPRIEAATKKIDDGTITVKTTP
jgi:basic membrane protein A and related proteins